MDKSPCKFSEDISCVGVPGYKNIASIIHKLCDTLNIQGSSKFFDSWGEEDEMVVQEGAVLLQQDGRVVGYFESDF